MRLSVFDNKIIGTIPFLFIVFTLILPLLFLVYYAFILPSNKAVESLFYYMFNEPYFSSFINTIIISIKVSVISVIISLFVTYTITISSKKVQSILLFIVISSMWLSILVRSYAWIIILQKNGLINNLLTWIIPEYSGGAFLYNQFSVILGMVHILVPYIILIHWSALREKSDRLLRISNSIGASYSFYFFNIYWPASIKSLAIGGGIVFILSVGYFITPLLLGKGANDTLMITMLIEEQINILANWKVGALISFNLLIIFSVLIGIFLSVPKFNRIVYNYLNEK